MLRSSETWCNSIPAVREFSRTMAFPRHQKLEPSGLHCDAPPPLLTSQPPLYITKKNPPSLHVCAFSSSSLKASPTYISTATAASITGFTMKRICGVICCLVLLLLLAVSPKQVIEGSLLPFLSRQGSQQQELDLWRDPFKILEQIPLGLERDEYLDMSPVRVDWKETPEAHSIIMDVPGVKREDLKIEVGENRVVRVSGERRKEREGGGEHWHCVERSFGKFWRQFRLPENANLDSVQARLQDGVLTITLPKLSPEKIKGPKVVAIDQQPPNLSTTDDYAKQEL